MTPAPGFETVIGLEVHVQLAVRTKLFSRAPAVFGGEPNTRVSVVDLALPGTLPALNGEAVRLAVRAALALEGRVVERTVFERKSYFYPDLPKGYQISQYAAPYCEGGRVPLGDGRVCGLERIHLEEDAGKTIHTERGSLVDLNRAGVALIEIVSLPDLRGPEDAAAYLENLKRILRYTGVSECDMEKGSLRCDANISLRRPGGPLGAKVEIKNLNSFKMVARALAYEERRQAALLAAGGRVAQETRLWNEERGETAAMRTKESAEDYRYFPDPDLPPLVLDPDWIEEVRGELPELPHARRERWRAELDLPDYDLDVLLAEREVADYFEQVARAVGDAKLASNWVMTEVLRARREEGGFPVPPEALIELLAGLRQGRLTRAGARQAFAHVAATGGGVEEAIEQLGLSRLADAEDLEPLIREVLAEHARAVADYRAGKTKALHALKGQVMRRTRGRADPRVVEELLLRLMEAP